MRQSTYRCRNQFAPNAINDERAPGRRTMPADLRGGSRLVTVRITFGGSKAMARNAIRTSPFAAKSLSIREWFLLGRFEPARAQRDYQWGEPQWKDLVSDLLNVFRYAGLDPEEMDEGGEDSNLAPLDESEPVSKGAAPRATLRAAKVSNFYLGHILLFRQRQDEKLLIYDGQQRLTTLTLLLCALRDARENGDNWQDIQEIIRTPPPNKEPRLSLPGGKNANPLAQIVGELNGTRPPTNQRAFTPAGRRMFDAAKFFRNSTDDWGTVRLREFTKFLLDNVFVTVTFLGDRRVAEYAYITTNTRGKSLENSDIIKGHFTQLASLASPLAANEIADKWAKLERAAGRRLDRILRAAFLLDFRSAPNFDFGAQLMDHFAEQDSIEEAKLWLGERLPELVAVDKELVRDPLQKPVLGPPFASIRRLGFLPWSHWLALLFRLRERDRNAPVRFSRTMLALERWCFGVNLLDLDEHQIINVIIKALDQVDRGIDPFAQRNRLSFSASWKQRILTRLDEGQLRDDQKRGAHVRWLETHYWPPEAVNFTATADSSVEHVLPQRPDGQWLSDFPDRMSYYTEKFGNLCLVPKDINDKIGNSDYPRKRSHYRTLPAHFQSAREVATNTRWTPERVERRTANLRDRTATALGLDQA